MCALAAHVAADAARAVAGAERCCDDKGDDMATTLAPLLPRCESAAVLLWRRRWRTQPRARASNNWWTDCKPRARRRACADAASGGRSAYLVPPGAFVDARLGGIAPPVPPQYVLALLVQLGPPKAPPASGGCSRRAPLAGMLTPTAAIVRAGFDEEDACDDFLLLKTCLIGLRSSRRYHFRVNE
jgi:hypothetical protein